DPTRVFTKEELLRDVWGFRSLGSTMLKHPTYARRTLKQVPLIRRAHVRALPPSITIPSAGALTSPRVRETPRTISVLLGGGLTAVRYRRLRYRRCACVCEMPTASPIAFHDAGNPSSAPTGRRSKTAPSAANRRGP